MTKDTLFALMQRAASPDKITHTFFFEKREGSNENGQNHFSVTLTTFLPQRVSCTEIKKDAKLRQKHSMNHGKNGLSSPNKKSYLSFVRRNGYFSSINVLFKIKFIQRKESKKQKQKGDFKTRRTKPSKTSELVLGRSYVAKKMTCLIYLGEKCVPAFIFPPTRIIYITFFPTEGREIK